MTHIVRAGQSLESVVKVLREGGLALLPTETVYGIGVSVTAFSNSAALPSPQTGYGRIFTLKQRELSQTVPWLVQDVEALDQFGLEASPQLRRLAQTFWPGALTLVVPARETVPSFMQAADGTVALRVSASPVIQELIAKLGSPLALTSANTHGASAPAAFADVEPRILDGVDVAVDAGKTSCCDASTIVAVRGGAPVILREGAISREIILRALE